VPLDSTALYRAHVRNVNSVRDGIAHIERDLRAAIARNDNSTAGTLLKILLLLTGSWAECRLQKLLYEPNGFDDAQRQRIRAGRRQIDWWQSTVEIGFRKRYNVLQASMDSLPRTALLRYNEIIRSIDDDLNPVIEMRNTLAHGQWERPLNSECTDISSSMIATIRRENALSARYKLTLLERLAQCVHDLVAGNHSFERDFDTHFHQMTCTKRDLQNRDYNNWKISMLAKQERGRQKRDEQLRDLVSQT
jgi:hypothetical protein